MRVWVRLLKARVDEIYGFRHLVMYLARASLQTERVGLLFGFAWWFLDPLMLLVVYTIVIDIVLQRGAAEGYPYPIFLLAAVLPWEFAVRATRNSVGLTFTKEQQMRQVAFPRAVVPLAATLAEWLRLIVALLAYPLIAIPFGVALSPVALAAIPLTLTLLPLTLGLAFFLSALNFFFRDTERLTTHGFRLWFFLSPALYGLSAVPARYRTIYEVNPFAPLLEAFRRVLLLHESPSFVALGAVSLAGVAIAVLGFAFFTAFEPTFAKRL